MSSLGPGSGFSLVLEFGGQAYSESEPEIRLEEKERVMGSRPAEQCGSYEGERVRHAAGCQSSERMNQRGDTHTQFPRATVREKLGLDHVQCCCSATYKTTSSSDPYILRSKYNSWFLRPFNPYELW